jgi:hypothetical protein
MTQNIASYKLQMFYILQLLQCLGFEVWAHLGSKVFGVFGLGYLHYKQQKLCIVQCATSQNVHCTSHQLYCTLFVKQTTKELHKKKEMQIIFVYVLWCIVTPHFNATSNL